MSDEKYPELEKMRKASDESQIIGEFLEWAGYKGYNFTETITVTEEREYLLSDGTYMHEGTAERPVGIEEVLAEYFEIDLKKVEEERRQLIRNMGETNRPSVD